MTHPQPGWPADKSGSSAKAKRNASDEFFKQETFPLLKIEITGTNLTFLQSNNREYVRGTVREGEKVYTDVGIHLKGAAGSFRGLDDRPALTLNFDKFHEDQKFHGIDKLHLNNSVQDASYLCENICGELFRAAGVPTPRVSYARVNLNGRDFGLYVLKEGFDKTFLKQYFEKAKGNLYDGGFLREITDPLERTSGEGPSDHSDLKKLVAAANEKDFARRWTRLNELLDMERFISFIALEVLTWHWDGYAMKRNNYRVYHDPTSGKFVFLPHGMDQMFWDANALISPGFEGLVARAVLETAEGKARYRARLSEIYTNQFQLESFNKLISELQPPVRAALAQINQDLARQHDGAVANLRNQITQRVVGVARQLSLPNPATVKFDASGVASLAKAVWQPQAGTGEATWREINEPEKQRSLHIASANQQPCVASWRSPIELPQGRYRFEARVRTAGVVPLPDGGHVGAGLRISMDRQPRSNHLTGDTDWQLVGYDFSVDAAMGDKILVCELRAQKGQVWFDQNSMRLLKK